MARSVRELQRQATEDEKRIVRIFNPLNKDVRFKYGSMSYKLKAQKFTPIQKLMERHAKKHLVDMVMLKRKVNPLDGEARRKIYEEISE